MKRPARVCSTPGCGRQAVPNNGKCRECLQKAKRESSRRLHRPTGKIWRRLRTIVLKRDPYCKDGRLCGGRAPSVHVDHIVPLHEGGHPTDLTNLQGICEECHVAKTQEEHRRAGNYWQGLEED